MTSLMIMIHQPEMGFSMLMIHVLDDNAMWNPWDIIIER